MYKLQEIGSAAADNMTTKGGVEATLRDVTEIELTYFFFRANCFENPGAVVYAPTTLDLGGDNQA